MNMTPTPPGDEATALRAGAARRVLSEQICADPPGQQRARKMWRQLNRELAGRPEHQDVLVARCTVERLAGDLGLAGAVRGKTTHHGAGGSPRLRCRRIC
jgi:hypothetical protein